MKLRSIVTSAFGVAILTQFAAPASAISLINENFGSGLADRYNVGNASTPNTVGGFTVTSGNVDLIGNAGLYDFYTGNGNYIDLNGNQAGTITSSVLNFAGTSATLSFNYGANGSGIVDVKYNGTSILAAPLNATRTPGDLFSSYSATLNGITSGGTLSFVSTSNGSGGIVLDNIKFDSIDPIVAAAVPEPADLLGSMMAFGSVVLLKRRMTKKNIKL
jgi:hypothetical protein